MLKDIFPQTTPEIAARRRQLAPDIHDAFTSFSERVSALPTDEFVKSISEIRVAKAMSFLTSSIALFIGLFGITNTMVMSVNERTREIGIRKAVGARRQDIAVQFLIESIALTGLGGALGILLGWSITQAVQRIPQASGLTLLVTPATVVIAVGVSVAIGIIFGLYPAMRAARLHPIQALRYE